MIWLIGNRGMLGADIEAALIGLSCPILASDIDVDITNRKSLEDFITGRKIDWIINCSAYTAVDRAEDEPDPAGAYGLSKLEGENQIRRILPRHYILRTAWLYGRNGNNFVHTMLRLFRERDEVRVVADQWGSPTYTKDLADAIEAIIRMDRSRYGTYHFTNEGRTTWHEFSREINALARRRYIVEREVRIVPITTPEYPTKARRPMNSCLSKDKIRRELGIGCRDWREALEEYIGGM